MEGSSAERESKNLKKELKRIDRQALRQILKYEKDQARLDINEIDKELRKLDIRLEMVSAYMVRRSKAESATSVIGSSNTLDSMFEKVIGPIYLMKLYELFGKYFDIVVKPTLPKVDYGRDG